MKIPSNTLFISVIWTRLKDKTFLFLTLTYPLCLSFGDLFNILGFQEEYFLICSPKVAFRIHEFWKLKQSKSDEWCQQSLWSRFNSTKHSFQPLKRCRSKLETSNLKFRCVKADCLEQKRTISWFQRPQMRGCVFVGRTDGRSVTIFWRIRPVCSRLHRPQAAAFGGMRAMMKRVSPTYYEEC